MLCKQKVSDIAINLSDFAFKLLYLQCIISIDNTGGMYHEY